LDLLLLRSEENEEDTTHLLRAFGYSESVSMSNGHPVRVTGCLELAGAVRFFHWSRKIMVNDSASRKPDRFKRGSNWISKK